ncbi:hypothetical protein ILUMI_07492, partial [Ignelater luminosus]
VQHSKGTGTSAENVYVPTLRYYEYLTFLDAKDTVYRCGVDTMSTCDEDDVSETQSTIGRLPANKRRATNLMKKQEKLLETAENLLSTEDDPAESVFGSNVLWKLRKSDTAIINSIRQHYLYSSRSLTIS